MTGPLIVFDAVGSTSVVLQGWASRAPRLHAGTTVVARTQWAARGSRGRDWISPAGNFAASVLLRPGGLTRDAGRLALVAAVALTDTLAPMVPGLRVKWPNDVMVGAAKLAGILVDAVADGPALAAAIVGVGVNFSQTPNIPGRQTCSLRTLGIPAPDPVAFAAALRDALLARAATPFEAVAEAWLARAPALGTPLSVMVGGSSHEGTFAGLSPSGHLLLRQGGGVIAISAGEVLLA